MKKVILSITAVLCAVTMNAQGVPDDTMNPLITAMPSLSIAPDARAAGLGDLGVATEADFNFGGGIGASFTYFSMGDVQLTDGSEMTPIKVRPNEWALDLSYFRKLHEYVSMSVAVRFLYSDLNNGVNTSTSGATEMHPAWTMAADLGIYYRQPFELPSGTSHLAIGLTIKNLGGKMAYATDGSSNFIPASLNIGAGYEIPINKYNFLTMNVEANKMMVPSRLSKYTTGFDANDPTTWRASQQEYSDWTSARGWFQSFDDAPGGSKEEFQEVRWGAGIEYSYNKQFFARMGYSYENYYKGNRNYLTFGAGFHLSIVALDVSYCVGYAFHAGFRPRRYQRPRGQPQEISL